MAWKERQRDADTYVWGQCNPIELRIEKPDLEAFILGDDTEYIVGREGFERILDASPAKLGILAKFALSVKALKEDPHYEINNPQPTQPNKNRA
jgi:hypothetical protein